jgi:ribosomal protein L12E/L44/L45/RPP1/RPP2
LNQFHSFLATDMKRAVAYLDQVVKTLEAYAGVAAPGAAAAAARTETKPAGEEEKQP